MTGSKVKKRVLQKLFSFEATKRDFETLDKEVVDGWYIASIMPHKGSFLCVLEKRLDDIENGSKELSIEETIELVKGVKKQKLLEDA